MAPKLQLASITARNLDEAFFLCIRHLFQKGRIYKIDRGSYEGHRRLEYDFITVQISHPGERPLTPILPQGVPPPTDEETVQNYAATYLMTDQPAPNEQYTYGQYLSSQFPKVIEMYRNDGHETNQAYMAVGDATSIDLEHPPCLRGVDTRISHGRLHFMLYFRSWDLWGGFPENLGGLQLLKEYMASEIGVEDGEIIACSKGLHIYDYAWPSALARLGGQLPESSVITQEEAEKGEDL